MHAQKIALGVCRTLNTNKSMSTKYIAYLELKQKTGMALVSMRGDFQIWNLQKRALGDREERQSCDSVKKQEEMLSMLSSWAVAETGLGRACEADLPAVLTQHLRSSESAWLWKLIRMYPPRNMVAG